MIKDKGKIMAKIVLTNGQSYIAHERANDKKSTVIKVNDIAKATVFKSEDEAKQQIAKAPVKCKGYYLVDANTNKKISETANTANQTNTANTGSQAKTANQAKAVNAVSKSNEAKTAKAESASTQENTTVKRINFSPAQRTAVYRKTKGHCYICGDFVNYVDFDIEHRKPLAKGGDNKFSNLYCACHYCNMIKQDMLPEDFMEKITQIFMYQMKKQHNNGIMWRLGCFLMRRSIAQRKKD